RTCAVEFPAQPSTSCSIFRSASSPGSCLVGDPCLLHCSAESHLFHRQASSRVCSPNLGVSTQLKRQPYYPFWFSKISSWLSTFLSWPYSSQEEDQSGFWSRLQLLPQLS